MNHTTTFYEFLMSQRNANSHDELATFAANAYLDLSFPKNSNDYHEIANYLELNATYLPSMTVFDDAWQTYQAKFH